MCVTCVACSWYCLAILITCGQYQPACRTHALDVLWSWMANSCLITWAAIPVTQYICGIPSHLRSSGYEWSCSLSFGCVDRQTSFTHFWNRHGSSMPEFQLLEGSAVLSIWLGQCLWLKIQAAPEPPQRWILDRMARFGRYPYSLVNGDLLKF